MSWQPRCPLVQLTVKLFEKTLLVETRLVWPAQPGQAASGGVTPADAPSVTSRAVRVRCVGLLTVVSCIPHSTPQVTLPRRRAKRLTCHNRQLTRSSLHAYRTQNPVRDTTEISESTADRERCVHTQTGAAWSDWWLRARWRCARQVAGR